MSFNTDIIDKIVQYKSVSKKKKIDRLLEIESNYIANNIGINISKSQKNNIRKNSRYIYRAISKINQEVGNKFLQAQDKDA
jgi:hypothetical protein|tara:strand:- start:1711 stop:1953 length:243 start_codon:yes stop_codon:yes gene_type:complete